MGALAVDRAEPGAPATYSPAACSSIRGRILLMFNDVTPDDRALGLVAPSAPPPPPPRGAGADRRRRYLAVAESVSSFLAAHAIAPGDPVHLRCAAVAAFRRDALREAGPDGRDEAAGDEAAGAERLAVDALALDPGDPNSWADMLVSMLLVQKS